VASEDAIIIDTLGFCAPMFEAQGFRESLEWRYCSANVFPARGSAYCSAWNHFSQGREKFSILAQSNGVHVD